MIDISANRSATKYERNELLKRLLWGLASPLFRFSFRTMFGWRRTLLRLFGASVAEHVHIYNTAIIYLPWNLTIGEYSAVGERAILYNLGPLVIGKQVTISQGAHLCGGTHDFSRDDLPLIRAAICICDGAWIASEAFVGPGVKVGERAVVGARAVVTKNVDPGVVIVGNPGTVIGTRPTTNPVE